MKLHCLSAHPSKPCFVLTYKGVTLMLDCGLHIAQVQHYMPLPVIPSARFTDCRNWTLTADKGKLPPDVCSELLDSGGRPFVDSVPEFCVPEMGLVDLSQVDAILISNVTCMLALPYVTEYSGFKGVVYATDPTLQIGRLYMEELVKYIERNPKCKNASRWKEGVILNQLPVPLRNAVSPKQWRKLYTIHDVSSCLSKVQVVGFNEKKNMFGSLTILASSSGFCMGSSNWVIESDYEKIAYVSGSSTLTTHPKPMEQAPLKNSDVLIMSCLTQTPLSNPDTMIGEFCVNVALTLKNGGNILVPCYPSGITYDLFECLSGHLDSCGFGHVPMYFVSPVSDSTLAYSNIFGEWLSQGKQNKVYLPEPPFPHAELMKEGRLKHYANIHGGLSTDMKQPCIVFTGHPSLRFGDVVHFLELWGKSTNNTIIFTEPDFPYLEMLAPFHPLAMRVCYCPIDTSLSFSQANKLIKELRPLHLVVSKSYLSPPLAQPHRNDLVIDWEPAPLTYARGEVLTIPVKRHYERIEITPELAATLEPMEVKPGATITMISAALKMKDNAYTLEPVPEDMLSGPRTQADGMPIKRRPYVFGNLDVRQFVSALREQDITDFKVEETGEGTFIHLTNDDTLIQIESDSTHIICGDETIRAKLRDALLHCLLKM